MKKLIFVRHGKAEESDTNVSDFMRSLTTKGKEVSSQMAKRLAKHEKSEKGGILIITSPAFRALETALIFAGTTGTAYENIVIREAIYGSFGTDTLIRIVEEAGEDVSAVALFGHNPSFSLLVNHYSGVNRGFMPKSGVACFGFDTDNWSEISVSNAKLLYFLTPDGTTD
jgi:phosphohistidine phosphatase